VRELRLAARADLAGLPVLRDADRARGAGHAAGARDAARATQQQRKQTLTVAVERSLILIKPDAVRRRLAGEILGRIEARGFEISEARLVTASRELGEEHYAEHREKPFFGELVEFITSGPTWALVVEGEGAIATMRATIGATDPANAAPGTIRGDLASSMPDNLVHGSDSPDSAQREIALWFGD
jgi:nucleoside-diphosphate kinase